MMAVCGHCTVYDLFCKEYNELLIFYLLAAASSSVPHPVRSSVRPFVTFVKTPIDMIIDNESESFRYY